MNIFILSLDHSRNAQYHVDKHIVKMPLECAQLLSTAVRSTGIDAGYKATHINHPCSLWVRESLQNYLWLLDLTEALNLEWRYRYGHKRDHRAFSMALSLPLPDLPSRGLTPFALAMPPEYQHEDTVTAYRQYYNGDKRNLFAWTNRPQPEWID